MNHTPILLRDHDGLRLLAKTHIGDEPVITMHNPTLIAEVAAIRRYRNATLEANVRQFT